MSRPIGEVAFGELAPYYDYLMRQIPYERWADYVEDLFLLGRHEPSSILDLCCGTGRFGLAMARRGYEVVGVDLSYPMARQAAVNARNEGAELQIVNADACALPFEREFDAVVSVFDSLNYITSDDGLLLAYESAARALRPRGLFVFDINTVTALREELFTQSRGGSLDRLHYEWRSRWDPAARLSTIQMTFVWRDEGRNHSFQETHVQRGYDDDEIRDTLRKSGLRLLGAYQAYTTRPLSEDVSRAFYLAVKR